MQKNPEQPKVPSQDKAADLRANNYVELKKMRDARDAEAATADRTARLYDSVLRWALGVEAEAVRAGVPLQDYLSRSPGADHALWLAVAAHREKYPASGGPAAVLEHTASAQPPSLRPWAPIGEIYRLLGSEVEVLARLADLTDDRVAEGFLAGPVARIEALAYRDAVRAGLAALRGDGRIYRQTYRILEDLAIARRIHDPELGRAADVLLDQLAHRLVEDVQPSLTPKQREALTRYFHCGPGEMQGRVIRGDEDDHLAEMIDAFDAYFVMCRAKLGHDRVPIATWETYTAIKQRHARVQQDSQG